MKEKKSMKDTRKNITQKDNTTIGDEENEYVLDKIYSLISAADMKIEIAMAITSAISGVFSFLSINQLRCLKGTQEILFWVLSTFLALAIATFLAGVILYFLALVPRGRKGPRARYSMFFGDIAKEDFEDYLKNSRTTKKVDYNDQLLFQIHNNAVICKTKMKMFKIGLWLSTSSTIASVILFISLLFL